MNRIKFTLYWDKLDYPIFTTIRPWSQSKEHYYRSFIGEKFQVWKAKEKYPFISQFVICHAWLEKVETYKPSEIPTPILEKDLMLNGQFCLSWLKRILKNEEVIILTFNKTHPKGQQRLPIMEAAHGSL